MNIDPTKIAKKELYKSLQEEDGMDPAVAANDVANMVFGSDSDDSSKESYLMLSGAEDIDSSSESDNVGEVEPPPKKVKSRRSFARRSQEDSNWFKRYLTDEAKQIMKDPSHRDTLEFKGLFRVSYEVFQEVHEIFIGEGWYNGGRQDCCKRQCAKLELLILGSLFKLGNGNGRWVAQSDTNVSKETHCKFFKQFVKRMASIQHRYIYMPRNNVEVK